MLTERAAGFASRRALIAPDGTWSYGELGERSARVATGLLAGHRSLAGARIAFLVPPSCAYAAIQWGIWRAGGVAVPLGLSHPPPELAYVLDDADVSAVVADPALADRLRPLAAERALPCLVTSELLTAPATAALPVVQPDDPAMILYTSGTTSKPKGVVSTHGILGAQITSVVAAWEWSAADHVLHVLPLHHLHGILNLLCCPLWVGATCELQGGFEATAVWNRIAAGDLTVFMAVPTIYTRLLDAWRAAPAARRQEWSAGCRRLRLLVSGSAALPVPLLEAWQEISGHTLLERYGMTEIGMALGNPLRGERVAGSVGVPFPGVEVRLVDDAGQAVADGVAGALEVRGPNVFREYWRRPEATAAAFTADGWFRTGDVALRENGRYRLLGRASVDIIKTGGFKVSALEIEDVLRAHPAIADCCVVGVADAEWGQRVAVAVVLRPDSALGLDELRAWAKERLAPYKIPTLLRVLSDLPRNAMGKPVKPDVAALFADVATAG